MSEFKQKLTIEASATGIPETARGLETVALAQQRLVEVNKKLAEARLTGTLDDVENLMGQQQSLQRVIGVMTGTQEKQNTTTAAWGEQLRRIHPLLGDAASALSRYGTAAGVAGALIAGLTAMFRALGEEAEKASRSVRDSTSALNSIKGTERQTAQSIENIRAGTRLGSFGNATEAGEAAATARDIRSRFGFLGGESIDRAVALTSGGSFTTDETARIARMMEIPGMKNALGITEKTSPQNIERRLRRGLERNKAELDKAFALESEQKGIAETMAFQQLRTGPGGSTLELSERIAAYAPAGANVGQLTELAQYIQTGDRLEAFDSRLANSDAAFGVPQQIGRAFEHLVPGPKNPILQASRRDLAILRGAINSLESGHRARTSRPTPLGPEAQPGDEVFGPPGPPRGRYMTPQPVHTYVPVSDAGERTPGTQVTNNYYNSRHVSPWARGQELERKNGRSIGREIEAMYGV